MSNNEGDGNNEGFTSPSSPSTTFRESILNSINGRKQHRMDDTDGGGMTGTVAMGSAAESSSTTGNGHESIQQPSGSFSSNTQSPLRQLKPAFQSRSSTSNREHQSPSRDNGIFSTNNKPLIRRRSSLFDSLPGGSAATMTQNSRTGTGANSSRSLLTFVQRLSQDSTLMNDDDDFLDNENQQQEMSMPIAPNNNNNNNKKRKSSLFGAVMKRFGSTNTASTGASGSRSSEPWPSPSTPTRKPSTSNGPKAGIMMSPTGNSIMNVVNRFVMNSPFRFQSPKRTAKRRLTTTATRGNSLHHSPNNTHSNSSLSMATPSPARKRRKLDLIDENTCSSRSSLHDHENWQEATIVNNQIHFIDWSIKTKARIECHPPECFWVYRCTQKWRDDLSYWQYNPGTSTHSHLPASRVDHSSFGQKTDPPRSKLASEKTTVKQQQNIDQATQILQSINAIRRDRSSSKATTSKAAASSSSLSESIQQRASRETRRRWQDAFQSLYIKYCKRMQSVTSESIMDDMLECYFYCVGVDHVVLFSLEATENIPFNKPRVIISNCCPSFLEELENAGVVPVLFTDDDENHHQKRKKPPPSPLPKPKNASPMSPTLKADLEALRRAQAFGTTAGADVHVKIHRKASSSSKNLDSKNAQHGPVCFKGMDDVSLFFEFYLNRFGCAAAAATTTTSSSNNVPPLATTGPQLPTLVSGGLGPFLHSKLSSLMARQVLAADTTASSSGVATTKGNGGDENDHVPSTKSGDDAVEIEGIILPCMVRKLLVRLAAHMTEEKRRTDGMNTSTTIINGPNNGNQQAVEADSDDGAHGSHYVVFHSIPDDDELLGIPRRNKSSGLTTSFVFNGWPRKSSSEDGKEETNDANAHQIDECSRGRSIQLMVWELNRSNVVACKLQKSVELPRSTITR